MSEKKGRILSGMRPSGPMHLGRFAGALRNWVRLQDEYECFYCIVDWHALMSEFANSQIISQYTWEVLADWLAVGLDPERATIFVQSHVPEHVELHMVLSCITPIPWLERCPTYKEQQQEMRDHDLTNYAFLGYPVLMAADILLYRADTVPVGDDQLPHLEITREIGRRFNHLYGSVFPDPQRIRRTDPGRPDYCNVHSYYQAFGAKEEAEEVARRCKNAQWGCTECKTRLAEVLIELLTPIRERREQLLQEREELEAVVRAGSQRAHEEAHKTMAMVHQALGF